MTAVLVAAVFAGLLVVGGGVSWWVASNVMGDK